MNQPKGLVCKEEPDKVCLLQKSLYGLKQSPRQWNKKFDEYMSKVCFVRSIYDSCVYVKTENDSVLAYLLLYVDDIVITSKINLLVLTSNFT